MAWIKHSRRSLWSTAIVLLVACGPTKAYIGPRLADLETSRVYFYSAPGIDTSDIGVDGVTQGPFDVGIEVLPGSHLAYAEVHIVDRDCRTYRGSFCRPVIASGTCNASFQTASGRQYAIRIHGTAAGTILSVEEETGEIVGSGSCEITDYDLAPGRP